MWVGNLYIARGYNAKHEIDNTVDHSTEPS